MNLVFWGRRFNVQSIYFAQNLEENDNYSIKTNIIIMLSMSYYYYGFEIISKLF